MTASPGELLDAPQPVRSEEALNGTNLERFLSGRFPEVSGPTTILQFRKGYSNLTYLIRKGDREMVLRRPPHGVRIKTAHDMAREFRILSHICAVYPKVPRPLAYCEDESVLGCPFYVMERVTGVILRTQPPPGLDLSPGLMQQLSRSFIDNLLEIHTIDYAGVGLRELGKPDGYVSRQVEGWTKRYLNARTDEIPDMDRVAHWLTEQRPAESGACLIHNDYKYDNLVLDPARLSSIKAVLDWEMATLGDPLMDLGSTLGYWVEANDPEEWRAQSFGVTTWPGNLDREQLVQHYARSANRNIPVPVFYFAYGLFKIAVIVQQIYSRYKQGLTQDERFARLIDTVRAASLTARLAIEKGRLNRLAS